jgi:hypothetical protein
MSRRNIGQFDSGEGHENLSIVVLRLCLVALGGVTLFSIAKHLAAAIVLTGAVTCRELAPWGTLGHQAVAQTAPAQIKQSSGQQAVDSLLGTLWTKASSNLAEGELRGCILEYAVLARDVADKVGALTHISGALGVWVTNRKIATTLKVVVHDIDPRTSFFTPNAPQSAYLLSGGETTKDAVITALSSNTPGGFVELLRAEKSLKIILQGISHGNLTIVFTRKANGGSVEFPVDSSVVNTSSKGERTKSPAAADGFLACNQSLVDDLEKAMK